MHTAALVASASGSDGGGGLRWAQLQPQHGLLCARLPPGAPLRASLCAAVADEEGVSAAWVTTCVGSLRGARLRLAGADRYFRGNHADRASEGYASPVPMCHKVDVHTPHPHKSFGLVKG